MPLSKNEQALLGNPSEQDIEHDHQRLDRAPRQDDKIGPITVVLLILNRTIGSGIFLTPHRILAGTGCVGGALLLWVIGALISICGLYVWLECGLSMPQRTIRGENEPRGVPRSGGEKNFLEFMFPDRSDAHRKHLRTTCSFAMMFLMMYNLSGNAISFALQVMKASGLHELGFDETPSRSTAIGIAIGTLTLVVISHSISRRGGILINNAFAVVKIALLLAIICLGIANAAGAFGGAGDVLRNNFSKEAFTTKRNDVVSWSDSLTLAMYAFSGYEQPFYVLAETKSPRKTLPRYTVIAMIIAAVLFVLVNISYLLVVDKSLVIPDDAGAVPSGIDLATRFFDGLFGARNVRAEKAMAALIALSIFGNLWVMTFTASRIKAEIAKEGILPWSLIFATSYQTPYGLWKKYMLRKTDDEVETAPTAAFALHWFTSILLVVLVSPIPDPRIAYSALVSLYAYTIIGVLGFWVSAGLLMIKLRKSKWHWQERRRYRPWFSPIHAVVYTVAVAFILIAAFVPPSYGSPFHSSVTGMPSWLIPAIGLTAPFWGILYYFCLLCYEWKTERELVVTREAYWMEDPGCKGEYVQVAEIIDQSFEIKDRDLGRASSSDGGSASDQPSAKKKSRGLKVNMRRLDRDIETGSRRLSDSF